MAELPPHDDENGGIFLNQIVHKRKTVFEAKHGLNEDVHVKCKFGTIACK